MTKENNLKEQFKQAILSTAKVISDDYKIKIDKKNKSSKNMDFFELDNLNTRLDFIKYRAEIDSKALRKKFSNDEVYKINLPKIYLVNLCTNSQKRSDVKFWAQ